MRDHQFNDLHSPLFEVEDSDFFPHPSHLSEKAAHGSPAQQAQQALLPGPLLDGPFWAVDLHPLNQSGEALHLSTQTYSTGIPQIYATQTHAPPPAPMPVDCLEWPGFLPLNQPTHSVPGPSATYPLAYQHEPRRNVPPLFQGAYESRPQGKGGPRSGAGSIHYAPESPFRQMRWADGHAHTGTVSPKELRRNPSPVLFANVAPLAFNIPVYQSASSEPLLCFPAHEESTTAFSKRRKQLPTSPRQPDVSADEACVRSTEPHEHGSPALSASADPGTREGTSSPEPLGLPIKIEKRASRNSSASIRSSGQGKPTPPREENSPALSDASDSDASYDGDSPRACSGSASTTLEMRRLTPSCDPLGQKLSAKDEFLVRHKLQGMTYRQIRVKGGFTEAESTLRGRFRTLTKNKEARVRKPAWTEADVSGRRWHPQGHEKGS